MTLSFWLVVALFVALLLVIGFYATFARWRDYLAGWSLMTLLVSFALLVGFTLFARFFADRALMYSLYNILLVVLISAVLFIGGVMAYERFAVREHKRDEINR
ncbi:holin [Arthrobacter phage Sicarius2]|uniref:Holin n=1 Tax=Arthrobacter phage Sicarius2 TaxID=2836090 RepID=A0A8F3E601_9CAUD|nr:holin [Arthrobacter phage Sicarius2]